MEQSIKASFKLLSSSLVQVADIIKEDMDNHHAKIVQLSTGINPAPRSAKYTNIDQRILSIVSTLDNQANKLEYIKNLSYIIFK